MILRLRLLTFCCLFAAASFCAVPSASAQVPDPEAHPAAKVSREFLTMIIARQWNQSADIVDEDSMKELRDDYVRRIDNAPTIDDEEMMLKRVGKGAKEEIAKMKPREFYIALHTGLQEQYDVNPDVLEEVRKTLTIKTLSVAEEGDKMAHLVVRTKHSNKRFIIERLELVTLINNGGKWQVALNQQAPKATPIPGAPPPKTPERNKPAADPVKPVTPKPAPKPAPPKRRPN
jgi:hypothetical protein